MIKFFVNGITYTPKFSVFPGGEIYVDINQGKFPVDPKTVTVLALVKSSEDLMKLVMLTDAIRRKDWQLDSMELNLPYVPYGRQDRVCKAGEAFSLKVIAGIINSLKYDKVVIDTPHSLVTPALIDNVVVIEGLNLDEKANRMIGEADYLVAPDLGAAKMVEAIARVWGKPVLQFAKSRVSRDKLEIKPLQEIPEDSYLLVLDDICDGGATFMELAKHVPQSQERLNLLVVHGIFSKRKDSLLSSYNEVEAVYDWTE